MGDSVYYNLEDVRSWADPTRRLDPPAQFAVIGDPVAHSRSPQLHNPALQARGIPAQYIRLHVPPGQVKEAFGLLQKAGFLGINCTIPHKFEALEAVDFCDPAAKLLGAVNTVAIRENGLYGYNSDGPGFLAASAEAFGKPIDASLSVAVIGARGGAGSAVAIQCAMQGCSRIVLINRLPEKLVPLVTRCQEISPDSNVMALDWTEETLSIELPKVDLIINSTPLGMKEADPSVIPDGLLGPHHLVFDMVYRATGPTPLIQNAQAVGAKTCDGLLLLLHQGVISFQHWCGDPVPVSEMRTGLASA